jgi:UDP-N-acetylglucosamine acyltransferase
MSRIDPAARVHPTAEIGDGCRIEADAFVGPNVRLGAGCTVECRAVVRGGEAGGAVLGDGCTVGAGAYVGEHVRLGAGNRLLPTAVVTGRTELGEGNTVHPGAVLGGPPQDLQLPGTDTRLVIGDGNVFREHFTANAGTPKEQGVTRIGSRCLLMAGSHVGHDCVIGDRVILTNGVLLAGHCHVGDGAVIGGGVLAAPFVSVGRFAFVVGGTGLGRDVPPFSVVAGSEFRSIQVIGPNTVGLRRNGFSLATQRAIGDALRKLFKSRADSGLEAALAALEADPQQPDEVRHLLSAVRASLGGRYMRAREAIRMKKG